jgi:hypothetical protein
VERARRKNVGGTTRFIEWILPLLLISTYLIVSGCASSRGNGAADTEELLGQEVKEGRVFEGAVKSSRGGDEDRDELRAGYRIQVVASTIREEADGIADVVKGLVPIPVYIEFSEPFYRVRVGDFRTKDEAEKIRRKLVDYGFDSAWIVETAISRKGSEE